MKDNTTTVDISKRNTMKGMVAAAAMISMPAIAMQNSSSSAATIDATLISIPGTDHETLILRNTGSTPLAISNFEQAHLLFDNEVINCGAVCQNETLVIPAFNDIMVHFRSSKTYPQSTTAVRTHYVQAAVSRLPEGTRVVPFKAAVSGSSAIALAA